MGASISTAQHSGHHSNTMPLYPARSSSKYQLVPTCDHEVVAPTSSEYPAPFSRSTNTQRYPRRPWGSNGVYWDWGWPFGPVSQPQSLPRCYSCRCVVHDGSICRCGCGEMMSTFIPMPPLANNGGCGVNCSSNDGGVRVKGIWGKDELDFRVGGRDNCPCDGDGGCEHNHRKAKSRSRSRKRKLRRRERRGGCDDDSGDDARRGERTGRAGLDDSKVTHPDLSDRVAELEIRLNNGLKSSKRFPTRLPFSSTQPDMAMGAMGGGNFPSYMGSSAIGAPGLNGRGKSIHLYCRTFEAFLIGLFHSKSSGRQADRAIEACLCAQYKDLT